MSQIVEGAHGALPHAPEVGFDVGAYTRDAVGQFHAGEVAPLTDADAVAAVKFLQRGIGETAGWLSYVLVTPTHKNARVTAFLTTWAYEQHWLAEALGRLVGPAGATVPGRPHRGLYVGPLVEAVKSNVYGHALTGAQLAERLVDSWLVDAMLARFQVLVPAAAQTLAHVRATLDRERVFFVESATRELTSSRGARVLARWRLRRQSFPVGTKKVSSAEKRRVFKFLFAGDFAWSQTLDARINALPGLRGLNLMGRLARRTR